MTKQFRKVLSILCAIAMLVSSLAMALAEDEAAEVNDVPATDIAAGTEDTAEDGQEMPADAPADVPADAPADAPADVPADAPADVPAEEPADAPADDPEDEPADVPADVPAEEPADVPAEELADVPAEEPADIPADEPADAPADIPAEEPADVPADIPAEEPADVPAEEPADVPADAPAEEASDIKEESSDEKETEEIGDSWGSADQDRIAECTPEITDIIKGLLTAEMSVGETLADTIEFDQELTITLKSSDISTINLVLYVNAGAQANTEVDGKAVGFTPAESDDPSMDLYTYELDNAAGRAHEIVLKSNDTLSFRLSAVVEQVEYDEEEDTEDTDEEDGSDEEVSADTPEETPAPEEIQVSVKTYDTLKVGSGISDSLVAGQKAKILVKCGKNPYVRLVLNAGEGAAAALEDNDAEFVPAEDGSFTLDLDEVAFRKFTVIISAEQDLDFTLSAISNKEKEDEEENITDTEDETEDNEEAEAAEGTEDAEQPEEETEEDAEPLTDEEMLELGYIKTYVAIDIGANVYDGANEGAAQVDHLDLGTELWVKLISGADRALIYNEDEEASAAYINLVDIITTLKPEGMEDLPTRMLEIHSNLEEYGFQVIYIGTYVTMTTDLINFCEDDVYDVQWQYSADGEEFIDIEDAKELSYRYLTDEDNVKYIWKVQVILRAQEEGLEQVQG